MTFTLTNFSVSSNFVQEPRFCTIFTLYHTKTCHQFPSAMLPSCMSSSKFPTRICIGLHTGYPSNPIIHPRFSSDFMGVGISPIPTYSIWNFMVPQRLLRIFSYVDRKIFGLFFHTAQNMQPPLLLCLLPLQVTLHSVRSLHPLRSLPWT